VAIVSSGRCEAALSAIRSFGKFPLIAMRLFIRPQMTIPHLLAEVGLQILMIASRRRTSLSDSRARSFARKTHKPDLRLIAELEDQDDRRQEFIRMDEHQSQLTGLQAENSVLRKACEQPKPTETASLRSPEVDTLNDLHFFDYEIFDVKGKGKNLHSVLFHNDRFTFAAIDGLELPTISALREGNKYVKVQATWVRNRWEMPLVDEGMVQVGKDSFKFRLRGKKQ
jgi:hypothetical protein